MNDFFIEKGYPLKQLSTFGIGGNAAGLIVIHTAEEMQQCIAFCLADKHSYIVIGKGSNTLFADEGFEGIVILNKICFFHELGNGAFHVGAGYSFSLLGTHTAKSGWHGLEFAAGIPATVGGALFMNAGANGQETYASVSSVEYIDALGKEQIRTNEQISFGYRTSAFQSMPGVAITAATFQLKPSTEARSIQQRLIAERKKKQPLQEMSAGCIFRNPPLQSAGALIEECGLKGLAVGGAEVSTLHANFIINRGHATASDVQSLIELIRAQVKNMKGIELQSEVQQIPYKLKR